MNATNDMLDFSFPVAVSPDEMHAVFQRRLKKPFVDYRILSKSLDARNKNRIQWHCKIKLLTAQDLQELVIGRFDELGIPLVKGKKHVTIVGAGPAGLFSALCLLKVGFDVLLIERGMPVSQRSKDIQQLEKDGKLNAESNYAYGEGGAGTFSDGKLTARTKGVSAEKAFVFQTLMDAGAPDEIAYMTHPHVGSDKLFEIIPNIRKEIEKEGGTVRFESKLTDLYSKGGAIAQIEINGSERIDTDIVLMATGHTAFDSYRLLLKHQVAFQNKHFAIGFRVEHPQELINRAQWNAPSLPGVKAAEYRLTFKHEVPVYSFCMCPGGYIIPASAIPGQNIVNGMSLYARDGAYANAAIVAGCNIQRLLPGGEPHPMETLEWIEKLEQTASHSDYLAPAISIQGFVKGNRFRPVQDTTYPLGTYDCDYSALLPGIIKGALQKALVHFGRQIKGFSEGNIIGLETKTSSPIQVVRNNEDYTCTYPNLFFAGEGSGWAGGIVSSAVDGIKNARQIAKKMQA